MLRSVMQTAAFLALRAHSIVPGVSWRSHTGRHTSAARLTFDWHSPARYATAKAFTYEPVESSYAGEAVIDEIDYDPARANSISLIGTAGRRPELKYLASGNKVAVVGVAVKDRKGGDGQWVDVELWGPLAERAAEVLDKGMQVAVQGRLKVDSWQDKATGQTRKAYKVVANSLSRVRSMRGQDVGLSVEEQVQQVSPALQQQDPPAQQQQQQQQWAMDPSPAAATALAPAQLSTLEERWMSFFEDPEAWTDLRQMKRDNQVKPRSPDFKKKNGGEGLWLDNRGTPAWVPAELAKLQAAGRIAAPPF